MDNDQESLQFWSSLLYSLADSDDPIDDRYPEISSPILVMSTSMAIDVPPQPWNAPRDEEKEAGLEKANAEDGDKNINEKSTEKEIEEEKEEGAEAEKKSLGKRPRCNENRNIAEKRRRTDIRTKIEKLKEMTPHCTKKDISSTLDSIIDHIRKMKLYVESQSVGPMLPLGMGMDFPAPWLPFMPPNFIMPYGGFTQGESSGHDQQIVPVTTQVNNQPHTSKSM